MLLLLSARLNSFILSSTMRNPDTSRRVPAPFSACVALVLSASRMGCMRYGNRRYHDGGRLNNSADGNSAVRWVDSCSRAGVFWTGAFDWPGPLFRKCGEGRVQCFWRRLPSFALHGNLPQPRSLLPFPHDASLVLRSMLRFARIAPATSQWRTPSKEMAWGNVAFCFISQYGVASGHEPGSPHLFCAGDREHHQRRGNGFSSMEGLVRTAMGAGRLRVGHRLRRIYLAAILVATCLWV